MAHARTLALTLAFLALTACAPEAPPAEPPPDVAAEVQAVLDANLARLDAAVQEMDDTLRPVPYLTIAQRRELQRFRNAQQVSRAREIGVSGADTQADLDRFVDEGRLLRLDDETEFWVLREMTASRPYVTPDVRGLLAEIGARFHAALAERDLPPVRFEVTSALRTTESQADLRSRNANAARNSAHTYGTTVDLAYNGFAAPATPIASLETSAAPWLRPYLERIADDRVRLIAARRSGELASILGGVLRDMQREGKVMVTYETQQPVFHMTVNQRYE